MATCIYAIQNYLLYHHKCQEHKKVNGTRDQNKHEFKIIYNVSKILEEKGLNLVCIMDKNSLHVSVRFLEWYKSNQIKIELVLLHSPDLNPIEN